MGSRHWRDRGCEGVGGSPACMMCVSFSPLPKKPWMVHGGGRGLEVCCLSHIPPTKVMMAGGGPPSVPITQPLPPPATAAVHVDGPPPLPFHSALHAQRLYKFKMSVIKAPCYACAKSFQREVLHFCMCLALRQSLASPCEGFCLKLAAPSSKSTTCAVFPCEHLVFSSYLVLEAGTSVVWPTNMQHLQHRNRSGACGNRPV